MRVTGISPLRGSLRAARRQAYHCVLTRSLRNSLSCCFVDGWVPLAALIGRLLCGEPHRRVLAHPPKSLCAFGASSGNVFQSPDVTGHGPVFFKVHRGHGTTPSLLKPSSRGGCTKLFLLVHHFLEHTKQSGLSIVDSHVMNTQLICELPLRQFFKIQRMEQFLIGFRELL